MASPNRPAANHKIRPCHRVDLEYATSKIVFGGRFNDDLFLRLIRAMATGRHRIITDRSLAFQSRRGPEALDVFDADGVSHPASVV